MIADKRHEAWLRFERDILAVPIGRSKQDLMEFREVAFSQHPALVPIISEYLHLAMGADTDAKAQRPSRRKRPSASQMHLFDLLREKTFFPQNLDLARFAERVMPHLRTYRFDKMSRSDIAARIIEHIESRGPGARDILEQSMREALAELSGKAPKETDRRSFLSKWERIIKGDEA